MTVEEIRQMVEGFCAKISKRPFQLYASGDNWWHFRRDPNSIEESFTVALTFDGTVVLTGDYGDLMLQRTWFPKSPRVLWGFPATGTDFHYFAEKVCALGCGLDKTEWSKERAEKDLRETLKGSDTTDADIQKTLDEHEFETEEEMFNEFMSILPDICDIQPGRTWSSCLVWQFMLLCVWGDYTRSIIEKERKELADSVKALEEFDQKMINAGWNVSKLNEDGTMTEVQKQ